MDWTIIEKISHHPVFISVTSIVTLIAGFLAIVSRTSWGKKAINSIMAKFKNLEQKAEQAGSLVREQVKQIDQMKAEVDEFKGEIKNSISVYFDQLEFFEKSIFSILSQIPNAKVQEQLKLFYDEWKDKKKEIEKYVGTTFSEIESKINDINSEKERQIATLTNEFDKLKELVEKLQNSKESGENEEREKTTNEEATKE